jgi:hypothetical protein
MCRYAEAPPTDGGNAPASGGSDGGDLPTASVADRGDMLKELGGYGSGVGSTFGDSLRSLLHLALSQSIRTMIRRRTRIRFFFMSLYTFIYIAIAIYIL